MKPLVIIAIILTGVTFYFSNNILPKANLKMMSLLRDVRQQKPTLNIREGIFNKDLDNYVIKVGKKDKDGKHIENIIIYDHSNYGPALRITTAKNGIMETTPDQRYLVFTLYDGMSYMEIREKEMITILYLCNVYILISKYYILIFLILLFNVQTLDF